MTSFKEAAKTWRLPNFDEIRQGAHNWIFSKAPTWLLSTIAHSIVLILIALIPFSPVKPHSEAPTFEAAEAVETEEQEITRFEVGETPLDPTELNTETLTLEAQPLAQTAEYNDDSPIFQEAGGGVATGTAEGAGLGFDVKGVGLGPAVRGGGGADVGLGTGTQGGRGGAGSGFGQRGSGSRLAVQGVTKGSERAVAAALNWFARHQNADGSWSLDHRSAPGCKGGNCTGHGNTTANAAATAMALLPFLGAGQTQESKGPYKRTIGMGLIWLMRQQKPNGDLSGGQHQMYAHGVATIALCEAYGMTQDSALRDSAQRAVQFIETSQNAEGGWRYSAKSTDSDTSVFGWQLMGLKSAHMAGLSVDPQKLEMCKVFLELVSSGKNKGLFGYAPGNGAKPSMTAVGLLGTQYLGAKRDDPRVLEGVEYLAARQANPSQHDIYYWYYATLAMHNVPGTQWDTWNRNMRRILIESQEKDGCAAGSWDPKDDTWGTQGGRVMITSLSTLTLEVYYRYLPLYQLDRQEVNKALNGVSMLDKK